MQLTILVGTVHGNALSVAQAIQMSADDFSASITVLPMDELTMEVFDRPGAFLICTSTTGSGDLPDNAQAFYLAMDAQARYLGHVHYGVIALGDSSYGDTFCGGGKRFDERLQDLGAHLVGPMCCLDSLASVQPEEDALLWCREWLPQLMSRIPINTEENML